MCRKYMENITFKEKRGLLRLDVGVEEEHKDFHKKCSLPK